MKECPFCRGDITEDVRKCKHCGEWVAEEKKEKNTIDSIKTHSTAEENRNGAQELKSLKQSHNKLRGMVADRLGKGYWGIEIRDDFPTHEEMVFLFSKVHIPLGFETIKKIQTEFPDCEAIKDGNTIAIEFEPKLSAFKDHQNEIKKCNCVICWEDDLEDYNFIKEQIRKHNIEIIVLKDVWEQFKIKEALPKNIEWAEKDFRKLSELQLRILSPFIIEDKLSLTKEEIQQISKERGKATGGALAGLLTHTNKRYPILKQLSHKYILDDRCRSFLTKILKESKMI